MRWLSRQLSDQARHAFQFSPEFTFVYVNFGGANADMLTTAASGQTLHLEASGPWVRLVFHVHAWSGAIKIIVNGREQVLDLYAPEHGFREVLIDTVDDKKVIDIVTGAPANKLAKGNQVWLAAIDFAEKQSWYPTSLPISPDCTLTLGEFGTFLTLTNDNAIGANIVQTGGWAQKDVRLFETHIKPGMSVLDVGANLGHHTVVFSKLVGKSGRVFAFEPQTPIFRLLAANAAINGCLNAELLQCGVGETDGFLHLYPISYDQRANFGALGIDPSPETRDAQRQGQCIPVVALDGFLQRVEPALKSCDFIKIDVQSYELFVLRGAIQLLKKFRPKLFLEIAPFWMMKKYDYREIYSLLWSLGYQIDHPSDPCVSPGKIKEWSGRENEEWDILAESK